MRLITLVIAFFLFSCGPDKPPENPTTCSVEEVSEGIKFTCTDKTGKVSTGIVRHGERGSAGQPGEPGKPGESAPGLEVAGEKKCAGNITGWMPNSRYEVDFRLTMFATGDQFLIAYVKLVRDNEVISERSSSIFYIQSNVLNPTLQDVQFKMVFDGTWLRLTTQGGLEATLPCEGK